MIVTLCQKFELVLLLLLRRPRCLQRKSNQDVYQKQKTAPKHVPPLASFESKEEEEKLNHRRENLNFDETKGGKQIYFTISST